MKIADYGNVIEVRFTTLFKVFHLPSQKTEGLNYLFDLLQNFYGMDRDDEDDFQIKISKHGVQRMHTWASSIAMKNWVEEIFSALQDK